MFHHELEKLRKILSKNTYSQNFTEKCIFKFLSKLFEHKPKVTTFPKKELKIILSYLWNMSHIIKTKLTKNLKKKLKFCKFTVFFKTRNSRKNYFCYKGLVPKVLRSNHVYQFFREN